MRLEGILGRVTALVISSVLCIFFAEWMVRLVHPQNVSVWSLTRDGIVVHRANIRRHTTAHGKRFETNSMGMRDREHAASKAGVYRILVLGDSFMEATQVEWRDSLSSRLEALLNEASDHKVEVITGAVSGWGTDDELTWYRRYGQILKPDLILVAMTLHNDVFDNLQMEHHVYELGHRLIERPRVDLPYFAYLKQSLKEWVAGKSHLYQLVRGTLRAEQVREGGRRLNRHVADLLAPQPSRLIRTGWEMTHRLLEKTVRIGAEHDADTAVFLIPLAIQLKPEQFASFTDEQGIAPKSLDLQRPQRVMARWGARHGIEVIDLLPEMRSWKSANAGDLYLESDGHCSIPVPTGSSGSTSTPIPLHTVSAATATAHRFPVCEMDPTIPAGHNGTRSSSRSSSKSVTFI